MPITNSARNIYEKIETVSSSSASFQTDGGSATAKFRVEKANLGAVVSEILGSVQKSGDPSGRLKRVLPAAHPYYDWLYATRINSITGVIPDGRQLGESYQRGPDQNYIYDLVTYKYYDLEIQFEPRPYLMRQDDDLKGDERDMKWYYNTALSFENFKDPYEYSRFVDIESEPAGEFLSSPVGQFKFVTASTSAPHSQGVTNQNGGGVNLFVPKSTVKFTWFFVPYEIVFSENVSSAFGKVNQYDFFGWPKGSLLMLGTQVKRYPPPEQLIRVDPALSTSVSQKLCDITFVCSSFIPPAKDVASDIPTSDAFKIKYGHNLLPRAGELKYYYVESEYNGRPIYESYPFERMFRLT